MRGLIFKIYSKSDILIFDQDYLNLNFDKYKIITINSKYVNIYYILKIFFSKNILDIYNFKNNYWNLIINSISPKIIISDNVSGEALKFKKKFPNIKSILYQHSFIYDYEINNYIDRFNGLKCDIFFVFDQRNKKIFSKIIKSDYVIIGSIKNNSKKFIEENFIDKKYDVLLISEFRQSNDLNQKSLEVLLKYLQKFLINNNLNIQIALNSSRKEKHNINNKNEVGFFRKYIRDYLPLNENSYKLANQSKVILCISSNIGLELLARNYRVLYVPVLKEFNKNYDNPYLNKDELFCKNSGYNEFANKLNFLLNIDEDMWLDLINSYNNKILFDEGNRIFYSKIDSILINKNLL